VGSFNSLPQCWSSFCDQRGRSWGVQTGRLWVQPSVYFRFDWGQPGEQEICRWRRIVSLQPSSRSHAWTQLRVLPDFNSALHTNPCMLGRLILQLGDGTQSIIEPWRHTYLPADLSSAFLLAPAAFWSCEGSYIQQRSHQFGILLRREGSLYWGVLMKPLK